MANSDENVKALNGDFVEQYLGKNIYFTRNLTYACPYCKLFGYAYLSNLKRDMRKHLKITK